MSDCEAAAFQVWFVNGRIEGEGGFLEEEPNHLDGGGSSNE